MAMTSNEAQAALERALAAVQDEAGHVPEVVTFIVGGRKFQILEQTINSKGQTMLSDQMSDPGRGDREAPIYIEGDADRFRHILDWYRFGSIKLSSMISLDEMKRECAFYGLPEDVKIKHEDIGQVLRAAHATREKLQKAVAGKWQQPGVSAAAHAALERLLADEFWLTGSVKHTYNLQQPQPDSKSCWVYNALQHVGRSKLSTELKAVADVYGLKVDGLKALTQNKYYDYSISLYDYCLSLYVSLRFGLNKLPSTISLDEMKRVCALIHGPAEDVKLEQIVRAAHETREKVQKAVAGKWQQLGVSAAAHAALERLLAADEFWLKGSVTHTYHLLQQQHADSKSCWVYNALQHVGTSALGTELQAVADAYGLKVALGGGPLSYCISLSMPSLR